MPCKDIVKLTRPWFISVSEVVVGELHAELADLPPTIPFDHFRALVLEVQTQQGITDYWDGTRFMRVSNLGIQILDDNKKIIQTIPKTEIVA